MKKEIKEAIDLIEKAQQKLEDLIYDREEYYTERSGDWQESEKGEKHERNTDEVRELVSELSVDCDSLQNLEL